MSLIPCRPAPIPSLICFALALPLAGADAPSTEVSPPTPPTPPPPSAIPAVGSAPAEPAATPGAFAVGQPLQVVAERPAPTATIIARDDLGRGAERSIATDLARVPGVELVRIGARNESTVAVRGFDARQVPVFIDGVPVYVPYDGYTDLGRSSSSGLDYISVEKGFASLLYGPNTLGGAINLVTRRPERPLEADAGIGATADRSGYTGHRERANLGGRHGDFYVQGGIAIEHLNGWSLGEDYGRTRAEDGGWRENSQHEDRTINAKIGWAPSDETEVAVGIVDQRGSKGTPPYAGGGPASLVRYWRWPRWDQQTYYAAASVRTTPWLKLSARAYYQDYGNSLHAYDDATYTIQRRPSSFVSSYDDTNLGGMVRADADIGRAGRLGLAAHWLEDEHTERNLGEPLRTFQDRRQSVAAEHELPIAERWRVVSGIGYDRQDGRRAEDYRSATRTVLPFPDSNTHAVNAQVGVFRDLGDVLGGDRGHGGQAWASVSQRSRFPSLKDRYSYRLGTAIPNPDLDVERARHHEIGTTMRDGEGLEATVTGFWIRTTDLIQQATIGPGLTQAQNIGEVRTLGGELGVAYRPLDERFAADVAYTYLDRSNESSSLVLTDVPRHSGRVWSEVRPWRGLFARAEVRGGSSRHTATDGSRRTGGFATAGAAVGWREDTRLGDLTATLGADNLADRVYAVNEGFPEPGRTFYGDLAWSF